MCKLSLVLKIFKSLGFMMLCIVPPVDASRDSISGGMVIVKNPADGSEDLWILPYDQSSHLSTQEDLEVSVARSLESKLHPNILKKIRAEFPKDTQEEVMVSFMDRLKVPRFPEPKAGERPDSPANQAALEEAARIVEEIRRSRLPVYSARRRDLAALGAEVIETFWLIDAAKVRLPVSSIEALARRADVLYIEPDQTNIPPPNSNPNDDVADARAYIRTDSLADRAAGGFVAILDTGVRTSHVLLSNPSPLRHVRDCVNGTSNNCTMGTGLNPSDDCWDHGTATAAIIAGNSNLGDAYRGVDWVTLDSFKVYPSGCGGLNISAAIRGFEAAVAELDRVIVAEMQGDGSEASSISLAADAAYDAGAIVVAANGNVAGSGTVRAPANAHKVLGVGAFDVETLVNYSSQSQGPTSDGRVKPDIQMPTNSETASKATDNAIKVYTGTSGAAPYAGGLAIGLRNWFGDGPATAEMLPGGIYAWMILMGDKPSPFNNFAGAGHARFVPNALIWRGIAWVAAGSTWEIQLEPFGYFPGYDYNYTAAIWWPEGISDIHNNIDLFIVDPSGAVRASSSSAGSVFQRARVPGLLAPGSWTLRIVNKGSRFQKVFFGAYRTNSL